MKLNNPPVIQTWIGFTFEPAAEKRPWNLQTAAEFLCRFESSLPNRQANFEPQYEVHEISSAHPPQVVGRDHRLDKVVFSNTRST